MAKRKPKTDPVPAPGRPATGQTPKRIFRATDQQWTAYQAAADRDGMTLSAWIRHALDTAAAPKKGGRR